MFHNASTADRKPRPIAVRLGWSASLALAIVLGASGCEDKAIGRTCDITFDASPLSALQAGYSVASRDCPSGICTKPAVQPGVSSDLNTGAYCTVRCNSDNDCNGQTRDFSNPHDTTPTSGKAKMHRMTTKILRICLTQKGYSAEGPHTRKAAKKR